jgi:hypothetical protein
MITRHLQLVKIEHSDSGRSTQGLWHGTPWLLLMLTPLSLQLLRLLLLLLLLLCNGWL